MFGLQDNSSAAHWKIHPGRVLSNGDIRLECECRVRRNPKTGKPSFLGPFVHGKASDRFLYLSWRPTGWMPGMADPPRPGWVRRYKVRLGPITWAQVCRARSGHDLLEALAPGTADDGGPACGSAPLVGGWSVRKA